MRSGLPSYCKCGQKLRYFEQDVSEPPYDPYTGRPSKYRTKCRLICPEKQYGMLFSIGHYKEEWIEDRQKDPSFQSDFDYSSY